FANRSICASSRAQREGVAGVCTLDPDDPHSPGLLQQFVRDYHIRGMRSIPAKNGQLNHAGVRALWKTGLEQGIVINLLIDRDKAPEAEVLLKEFSGLSVVLDHCLNLKAGPDFRAIFVDVPRLSRHM